MADVARVPEIERLCDAAEARLGPLDVVVANAATFVMSPLAELSEADYDRVFDLNAKGAFFVMQQAVRRLRAGGRMGQPAEVGDVIAFLAGPDARWVTGQCIGAGGGAF